MRPDDFLTERFATGSDALDANPFATITVFNQELAKPKVRQRYNVRRGLVSPPLLLEVEPSPVMLRRFVFAASLCSIALSKRT
jgi:hypothetical protein